MKASTPALAGVIAALAAAPAYAHGEGAVIAPAIWGGLGIGAVAGAWAGWKGSHPGVGLGWGIGALFLALVTWSGIEGELLLGTLLFLLIVPFAGAIPLAVAFLATYAGASLVKERWVRVNPPSTHEH